MSSCGIQAPCSPAGKRHEAVGRAAAWTSPLRIADSGTSTVKRLLLRICSAGLTSACVLGELALDTLRADETTRLMLVLPSLEAPSWRSG